MRSVQIFLIALSSAVTVLACAYSLALRRRVHHQTILAAKATEAAGKANRARSESLANMSYEMRTPLNGIAGTLDLVLETALTPEQRDYLSLARSSTGNLLSVVDGISDFAKIETGELHLESRPFALYEGIQDAVRPLQEEAAEKRLSLVLDMEPGMPSRVIGDLRRLRQVLTSLIGNAVKYTNHGGIQVEIRSRQRSEEALTLQCTVRDTGIGVSEGMRRTIFDAFERADTSITRQFGGAGLGLAVSSRLVEAMGGRMSLESEMGKGCAFTFTAVFKIAAGLAPSKSALVPPPLADGPMPPLTILVAEDNPINQRVVLAMLRRQGHTVHLANDGAEAVAMCRTQTFDAILLDIQMPVMDGLHATAMIRILEVELGRGRTPIVALTAHAMPGDRERCLNVGMDGYLAKPVHMTDLMRMLRSVTPAAAPILAPVR